MSSTTFWSSFSPSTILAIRLAGALRLSLMVVPLVLVDRELVGPRKADVAHQMTHVESALHEIVLEGIEQLRIAGRIAAADVIHRIDDAAPEEIAPGAVGHCLGEIRIVL